MKLAKKIYSLELLRFFSAISVLFWHYQHFWVEGTTEGTTVISPVSASDQPLYNLLSFFYYKGYLGVTVFWAISGFIFFHVYFDNIKNLKINYKSFFISRFSRLYPLHLITLLFVLALQINFFNNLNHFVIYEYNDLKHFILNFLLISHWGLQDGPSFNAPIWSVSVEILVYITFFTLVRFLKTFFIFFTAGIIFLILIIFDIRGGLTNCLFIFFSAGFIYLILIKLKDGYLNLFIFMIVTLLILNNTFISEHYITNEYFYKLYININILCTISLFVKFDVFFKKLNLNTISSFLGNLTYSIYLLQVPLQLVIFQISDSFDLEIPKENNYFLILYMLSIIFISHFSYKFLEIPLKNYFRKVS